MKKAILVLFLAVIAIVNTGCSSIQESLAQPVAVVSGKVVVPAGQRPEGISVSVAGIVKSGYVDHYGNYRLELNESGRYLIIAHGAGFDPSFVWVDAKVEESVKPENIKMTKKITGEALWIASLIDFPKAKSISVKPISPTWNQELVTMHDDGLNGDILANDGIFALRMQNLTSGYQEYSFVWTDSNGKATTVKDPHAENRYYTNNSTVYIPEAPTKQVKGKVISDLTGVNYSEVKLATKKGSRSMKLNSDGSYVFTMEGSGREYLVFRSENFHVKIVPVDLSSVNVMEHPDITLASKKSGEIRVMLVASDFVKCENPTVVGDFTSWHPMQLYDDGTYGDEVAGDGVYTRTFTGVPSGYHRYAFNITSSNQVKDPYQESEDSTYSIIQVK